MPYSAMPVKYVSLESGHLQGPDEKDKSLTRVETEAIAEMAATQSVDGTKNVVVLTVENLHRKAHDQRAMEPLALKLDDCKEIVRDMLIHMACSGDAVAQFLLRSLAHATGQDSEE